jgi:cyclophilin family peptidyl-prolyl cis-trans isomerase
MPKLSSLPSLLRLPLALSAALLVGCGASAAGNPKVPAGAKSSGGLHATMVTDKGTIEFELDEADSPKAVENFRLLAEHGYYDGTKFHRIVSGFMIQGGDPAGDGSGGESAWGGSFDDNIKRSSDLYQRGYRRGVLAMANSGPNTNASQFFIMHKDYPLPPNYVIFGQVTHGIEVVDALGATPVTMGPGGEMSRPLVPPVIRKVTILP